MVKWYHCLNVFIELLKNCFSDEHCMPYDYPPWKWVKPFIWIKLESIPFPQGLIKNLPSGSREELKKWKIYRQMDSQRYDGQQLVIAHSNSITLNGKIAPPPTSLSVVIVMDTGTMWLKGDGLEKGRKQSSFFVWR